jgi:hypothetical protein
MRENEIISPRSKNNIFFVDNCQHGFLLWAI